MSRAVLLDSGPLGLVTNPKQSAAAVKCTKWLQSLISRKVRVVIPEIADYEIRRELLRAKKSKGLAKLDTLAELLEYLPLTTEAMRQAPDSGPKLASRVSRRRVTRRLMRT